MMISTLKNMRVADFLRVYRYSDTRFNRIIQLFENYQHLFADAPGSGHNHQAWPGGYLDHVAETLRINEVMYDALSQLRPVPFSKESAAMALFFHDIEKPFKYGSPDNPLCAVWHPAPNSLAPYDKAHWESAKFGIIGDMAKRFHFTLTDDEMNAIRYTHGEGDDYNPLARVSTPLAAHVGNCDRWSARGWPEAGYSLG